MASTTISKLPETDPKYLCFCSSVHVKTGALIFALINFIMDVIMLAVFLTISKETGGDLLLNISKETGGDVIKIMYLSLSTTFIFFFVLYHRNSNLIFPHLSSQVLLETSSSDHLQDEDYNTVMAIYAGIGQFASMVVVVLAQLWMVSVTYRCYEYIKEMEKSSEVGKDSNKNKEIV